jgi:signal transduction histidine kinase
VPDAALDQFMSVVAHDLRNPIAVAKVSGQMALRQMGRGDLEAAQRRVQAIVDQTERLSDMIEAFQEAARVSSDRVPVRAERCDLGVLVQEAVQRSKTLLADRVQRDVEVSVQAGVFAMVDPVRMTRVIRAIVDNAFLYGDPAAPVQVTMTGEGSTRSICVSGGGAGPRPEEEDRLFTLFYRGHAAAESGHPGSGTSLYTARGIARAHGGDVRRVKGGPADAFEIELPLAA